MWEKVESLLNIDFESKLVYGNDEKYIKTKLKVYATNASSMYPLEKHI